MTRTITREQLRTVHLVPLTALDAEDRINEKLQAEHIARMAAAGMRVFLPAAGTSEFHSLMPEEIVQLVRITRQAAGREAVIFAPVGAQIRAAIETGLASLEAGANGVMFMPFSHPYLSDEGALRYYEQVLDALQCPALIYRKANLPSDGLLLKLADHPHVIGIKYAVNDIHGFRRVLLQDQREDGSTRLEWLCGSAERFSPFFMLAGSTGYTTGAGNLCPHLTLAMHAAIAAGEWAEGMRYQQLLLPIEEYRARAGDSYNISMLKYGMRKFGQDFGPARAPQRLLTEREQAEIDSLLDPILAAEFELQEECRLLGLSK